MLFYRKSVNSEFLKTTAACDLKAGIRRLVTELFKVYVFLRSMSFLDIGSRSFTYENQNLLFSETTGSSLTKFCM